MTGGAYLELKHCQHERRRLAQIPSPVGGAGLEAEPEQPAAERRRLLSHLRV